jgi:hypothetical protein
MPTLRPWSAETDALLASMPPEGDTHRWFARVASRLAGVLPRERTERILLTCAGWVTHRRIPDKEVMGAVAFGYGDVKATAGKKYQWPEPQPSLIGEILGECEPICNPSISTGLKPMEVLGNLFERYQIICVAMNKYDACGRIWPDDFDDFDVSKYQYIVPNPLAALVGTNNTGDASVRCQNNIASRRYVVAEFDKEPDKANQAKLIGFLSETIPCVMVIDSGGKSLHGWFPVYDKTESEAAAFFAQAVTLGADQSIYDRAKLVRLPGGLRDGKIRQKILYFDEGALP